MPQNPAIFISHRRSDAAGHARRLHQELCRRFASEAIFFDRQSIESGEVFPETLRDAVRKSRAVLVLIGPDWLQAKNAGGQHRLEDPQDFVRQEIAQALNLNKTVMLVLFDDTPVPAADELPEGLKPLAHCDPLTLRGKTCEYETQLSELVRLVAKVPGVPKPLPDLAGAGSYYRCPPPPQPVDPAIIEQAQQKLAQMPLDRVPKHATPYQGSGLAFVLNPLFVGRESDLINLARLLQGGQNAATSQVAVATGMDGIGKTQLAKAFARRYGPYFAGGVYWLNFADPQAVPVEVAGCSHSEESQFDLETQIRSVLSAWQSELPRLLVFDNCEDEFLFDQWRPKTGASRVLITSRRPDWNVGLGLTAMPLGVLARHESIALLQTLASRLDWDQASAIADELGDLPLALHLAGNFLRRYADEVWPENYLRQLQDRPPVLYQSQEGRAEEPPPTQHDLQVERTFALSYDKLNPQDNIDIIALSLLARAACLAPGIAIPRALLLKTLGNKSREFDPLDLKNGLSRILDLRLIESGEEGDLVLHRLLATYVQHTPCMDTKAQKDVEVTLRDEANRINNSGLPAGLLAWQAHLRFVTDLSVAREDETGAQLCSTLGYHLHAIGDLQAARPYYEKALEIRMKVLGEAHPVTAQSSNNLGFLLLAMGDLQAARPCYEKALEIRKRVLGEAHPVTAQSLNNLGFLLQAMGDLQSARPYYEKAAEIRKKVLARSIRTQKQ